MEKKNNIPQQPVNGGKNIQAKPLIIVDDRERELHKYLLQTNSDVIKKRLEIGDALTSEHTVIERKTRDDFESSIIDKRLFHQMEQMIIFPNRIVIIEGSSSKYRIRKEAILGAYSSILTDYKTGIFFTKNIESTSKIIHAIAKHEQIAIKRNIGILAKRKALTFKELQLRIIESLPNIGPGMASKLLNHFGTLNKLFTATSDELSEIDGIGKLKSKMVWNLINRMDNEID